jgi:hypothetical protein
LLLFFSDFILPTNCSAHWVVTMREPLI